MLNSMEFKDKYCPTSEKDKLGNKDKKILSEEAYAMSELLDQIRIQLFRGSKK